MKVRGGFLSPPQILIFRKVSDRWKKHPPPRYNKTHPPADGIPIFDTASYIVVARDGRDAFMSFANHMKHMRADLRECLNAEAIKQGIAPLMEFHGDIHGFFDRWITDALPDRKSVV